MRSKRIHSKIVIIGTGNVATYLGLALSDAGHRIDQIYGRNAALAGKLAEHLHSSFTVSVEHLNKNADLYIIAVKDSAINDLSKKLRLPGKLVVHTSGSIPVSVLSSVTNRSGVFYPLQTFSKQQKTYFAKVPLLLEASSKQDEKYLMQLAGTLSGNVQVVNSERRLMVHLAAVFACNFSNHLYTIADTLLKETGLSFDLLKPLIAETARKIKTINPGLAQTGPAIRGDKAIINMHLKLLRQMPEYMAIYRDISNSIVHVTKMILPATGKFAK